MTALADITLTVEEPPSANRLYRRSRTTIHKAPAYKAWKDAAAFSIACQLGGASALAHFSVSLAFPPSLKDLDNRIKPVLDAIQAGGAIRNDRGCRSISARVDDAREGTALVHLWAAEPPPKKRRNARRKIIPATMPDEESARSLAGDAGAMKHKGPTR